jgi:exodeoxyribonuclease VII large subunit
MIATATIPSVIPSAYSPAALLTVFGNSLASPLLNKIFTVKGIYKAGKGVNYNGHYYDNLKDECSDVSITLLTPPQLRVQLRDGGQIEASVCLSKRFQASGGRIEVQLMINELLSQQEKVVNDGDTKALALIQQKAKAGLKDADSFIKRKLFEQHPISVTILIGQSAIIDQDIQHQLKDACIAFKTRFVRINLARITEIIQALQAHQDTDILVIARGGGENMNIFDNPEIAATAITLKPIFLTALGHSADEPLLQKVADKALITPTALGQYFYDLYAHALEYPQGQSQQIDLQQVSETIRISKETTKNILEQNQALYARMVKIRRANQLLGLAVCVLLLIILVFWSKHA